MEKNNGKPMKNHGKPMVNQWLMVASKAYLMMVKCAQLMGKLW